MKILLYIIQKEFVQIFRNRTMIPVIFVVPFVQLLILVNAATLDMKHIELYVVDKDMSTTSRSLADKFYNSPFFVTAGSGFSEEEAQKLMLVNKTDLIVVIPENFEKEIVTEGNSPVQLQIDAINGMTAGLINSYATQIILDFNRELAASTGAAGSVNIKTVNTEYTYWYNQELNFKFYMVPGILVILLTLVSMFLAALNLVREKEMGTIEQINVTPIKKYQFVTGKLVPFWLIAMFELGFGLALGKALFNIPIEGSILLLYAFAALYLVAVLGMGLLLSAMSQTQQQVMFLNFFFMITFILMSGIFTPAESMPHWAQRLNFINPLAYFMRVIRMILLKGSGFSDISHDFAIMAVMAVVIHSLAIWRFRKTT
jgi:ABC-2 type transport system permease protein